MTQNKATQYNFCVSTPSSAFNSISQPQDQNLTPKSQNYQEKKESIEKNPLLLPNLLLQKESNGMSDAWHVAQIQKLFKLYDEYGPQWKRMSEKMPLRTANNLKNRFYTVLRNLIKLLFRKMAQSCPKLPGQIPSKDLSCLYDGKQAYEPFKHLISKILCEIGYDFDSYNLGSVVKKYSEQIIKIYHAIYGERVQIAIEYLIKISQQDKPILMKSEPALMAENIDKNTSNKGGSVQQFYRNGISQIQNQNQVLPLIYYFYLVHPNNFYY